MRIQIENELFTYEIVNDYFVKITEYDNTDHILLFRETNERFRNTYHIHIPEEIDGYPVIEVARLYVEMKVDGENSYAHNGSSGIIVHLPEGTSFQGFKSTAVSTARYASGHPAYSTVFYPRKRHMNVYHYGGWMFYVINLDESYCEIMRIVGEPYNLNDNIWDSGFIPSSANVLNIPDQIGNHKPKSIAPCATNGISSHLHKIMIPDTVETIGDDCFTNLGMISFVLMQGVKEVGENCFGYYKECRYSAEKIPTLYVYCNNELDYPPTAFNRYNDVEIYEDYADWGPMYQYTTVKKHEVRILRAGPSIEIIDNCLVRIFSLESVVTVPNGVTEIASFAFLGCLEVKEIILPESIKKLQRYAFADCMKLQSIRLPDGLTHLEREAFYNCLSLTDVELPDSLQIIDSYAFYRCLKLSRIVFPGNLKRIDWRAFVDCVSLKEISLPASIEDIGSDAFAGCPIESVKVHEGTYAAKWAQSQDLPVILI